MHLSLEEFVHGGGWHGYDVVRLYTNNDLHDLVARLSCVIGWAWEFHTTQQGDQVVQVFEDSFHGCRWWQGIASLYDPVHGYGAPGAYNATVRKCMYNACCGRDPVKGKFYVFTKNHVVEVLTWLVQDSYVRFGDKVFKQTRGIPTGMLVMMGINPAVYIANYYLFYYELCFIQQLVHLVTTSNAAGIPVSPQAADIPVDEVLQVLQSQDRGYVDQHVELHGQAGMFLLHQYRCTVRFVDDLTSGPNPFTAKLLYESQTCMGGLIHGIYPGQFLVLDATPGDRLFSFNTLDVQIVTDSHPVVAADGSVEHMIKSHSLLFDKRRLPCYADIPMVQFTHVSSSLSLHCGYNTLIGQLHRF